MNIMDIFIAVARGLDIVEGEVFGATSGHSKRVASICNNIGRSLGLNDNELITLTICALFHDIGLTELLAGGEEVKAHCIMGQHHVDTLPLPSSAEGLVLYHHERSDGSGKFGLRDVPLSAEIICFADSYDCKMPLDGISAKITEAFDGTVPDIVLPQWDTEPAEAMKLGDIIATVIDFKSTFTRNHTVGIAAIAKYMAKFYGYDEIETAKLYLAACTHDLGKLATPSQVLEKTGKLTKEEFEVIKDHCLQSFNLLDGVDPDIRHWAAGHHEKLDGSGYPFGLKGDEIHFNARLMACIDIYQAVSEKRPYHPPRSHEETVRILYQMAENGGVSESIVKDLDAAMSKGAARQLG